MESLTNVKTYSGSDNSLSLKVTKPKTKRKSVKITIEPEKKMRKGKTQNNKSTSGNAKKNVEDYVLSAPKTVTCVSTF